MVDHRNEIAIDETIELLISLRATDYEDFLVSIPFGSIQSFVHRHYKLARRHRLKKY